MVWDDGEYGLIKWKQQNQFKGRHSELAFNNPDFELLARSFGAWGRRVGAASELRPVLDEAFRQKGPALVAVPVDYGENLKLTKRLGNLAVPI
jgi:acetolactate synthase-1/2/3 large subunit